MVVSTLKIKFVNSDKELTFLLEQQEESSTISKGETSTFLASNLWSLTRQTLCWSLDSKKISTEYWRPSEMFATKKHSRFAYSLPPFLHGSSNLLAITWKKDSELSIWPKTWRTKQHRVCNIWLSNARSKTECQPLLISSSFMEVTQKLSCLPKQNLTPTHWFYPIKSSKTLK